MKALRPSEWIALLGVGGLLAILILSVALNQPSRLPKTGESVFLLPPRKVKVEIAGAVAHGGIYLLEPGATVGDLLDQTVALDGADLRQIDLGAKLRNHQKIEIPRMEWIEVKVYGEGVQPGSIQLPKGATVGDLLKVAELDPHAALWRLRKRQPLADGDTIEIRKKRAKRP